MAHAKWDQLPPEEQERLQMARLREFLTRQVLPFHPHYREVFAREGLHPGDLRTLADMARIPFSAKSLVAPTVDDPARPRQFVLQPTPETIRDSLSWKRKLQLAWTRLRHGEAAMKEVLGLEYRPVQVFFTTGRTALPTSFVLSRYDLEILELVGRRIGDIVKVDSATDRVVSVFPYAPHLAFWQVHAVSVATGTFALHTGGGKVMGTGGILKAVERVKPTFLAGIPGYVYHLLRTGVEDGIDMSSVRTVFLGGDRIPGGFREKLVDILREGGAGDPRIVSVLGFTEAKKCWSECFEAGHEGGWHTYPDLEIFEVLDPETGDILPDGETGELAYTYLDGRGSVVLRYRTGDIAEGGMTRARCPGCGRQVPRVSSNLSRVSNQTEFNLTKIKGSLVNLTLLGDLLQSHPRVDEWQLVIRKRNDDPFDVDELHLALALRRGTAEDATVEEVGDAIFHVLEIRPHRIEVLERRELLERLGMETRLKENRIVDLRSTEPTPAGVSGEV